MKWAYVVSLAVLVAACGDQSSTPDHHQDQRWVIAPDSISFAVLVVDYATYAFEGGTLAYYDPCSGCAEDSLPLRVDTRAPGDFGWILFSYVPTGETAFAATIVWAGRGQIRFPHSFVPPDSFVVLGDSVSQPPAVERFQFWTDMPQEAMAAATDSVWSVVRNLDIVHAFPQRKTRLGYYLYPPSIGGFDPAVAKWIVFLCHANE